MRARDLVRVHPTLSLSAPASGAVRLARATGVRSFLVVDQAGALEGVLSDTDLLRAMLPPYVEQSPSIGGLLGSDEVDLLWEACGRTRVEELIVPDAVVAPDDTLVQVMWVMVRTRTPLVGVVEDGRLLGGISASQLLERLPPRTGRDEEQLGPGEQ